MEIDRFAFGFSQVQLISSRIFGTMLCEERRMSVKNKRNSTDIRLVLHFLGGEKKIIYLTSIVLFLTSFFSCPSNHFSRETSGDQKEKNEIGESVPGDYFHWSRM
jgi:hypothetical protein